ncbi:MAG: VPLPA-CTERM sorting domain-containing protein [Paracoccaceae bacterium]
MFNVNLKGMLAAATVAIATSIVAGSAGAATVTQLVHFDDAKNGAKDYTTSDGNFFFAPTNFQSSTLCADSTNGGNGSCLIENNQSILPKMTRLTGDNSFSLDSFYFLLTGKGTGASNAITVSDGTNTQTYQLGTSYSSISNYVGGTAAGTLVKNTGYVADIKSLTGFKNITSIQFSAASTAQVRLDCVVASFDGSTTEPLSGFTQGCGGPGVSVVPVPASLPLLLTVLVGGGAFMRRRARKAT